MQSQPQEFLEQSHRWEKVLSKQESFSTKVLGWPIVIGLLLLVAAPVVSQNNPSSYILQIASGILCDGGDSSNCPAVVKSARGDSYEMSGAGTFETQNKSAHASGSFVHKAPSGDVFDAGVWIATGLVSFESYGITRGALHQNGVNLRLRSSGLRTSSMSSSLVPTGGLAVFSILLVPMSGKPKTALLQVNCASGNVPDQRSIEGIRLTIEKNGGDFSEEAGGRVMFLATPAKAPSPSLRASP
jgi:hypothetical protein